MNPNMNPKDKIIYEEGYRIDSDTVTNFSACYGTWLDTDATLMVHEEALNYDVPLILWQIVVVMFLAGVLYVLLRPLFQTRFVCLLIAAIVFSYFKIGSYLNYLAVLFDYSRLKFLETLANHALIYHIFLIGMETDITFVTRVGKKALSIALSGIIIPTVTGGALFFAMRSQRHDINPKGYIFWALALTVTSFPELASVLADQKLLYTDIGRTAISTGIINDLTALVLLTFTIATMNNGFILAIVFSMLFVLSCVFLFRPSIKKLLKITAKDNMYKEYHFVMVIAGISAFAFITDALGMQPFIGAFVFGLMIPDGELKKMVREKLYEFGSVIFFSLYFLSLALKVKLKFILFGVKPVVVAAVVLVACMVKIVSTFFVSVFHSMSPRESWALGLLLNTKGFLAIMVLEAGRDMKVLDFQTYSIMFIAILVMTATAGPLVAITKKSNKRFREFRYRPITKMRPDEEFKILVGIHSTRDVMATINILEASNATKDSPIAVSAVHLVELTERANPIFIVHDNIGNSGATNPNRPKTESENIIAAFENYEGGRCDLSAQFLTAVSPYATMHEDICGLAEDRNVHLIILPFHKQPGPDGTFEQENPSIRAMNQSVMDNARRSVGIFIDRKLGFASRIETSGHVLHFAMFFFGGPDDREALAYARRMASHPDVYLTVIRFLPGKDVIDLGEGNLSYTAYEREKHLQLDSTTINHFRFSLLNEENIEYHEKMVNNGEDTLAVIRELDKPFDMYIVGRGQKVMPALTSGLAEWNECPELGALGDTLMSSDFSMHASVLVIQQYSHPSLYSGEDTTTVVPQAYAQAKEQVSSWKVPQVKTNDGFDI